MAEAKHTPGEWSVLEHEGEVFILAGGAMQIAQVTYVIEHAGETGSRRLQNARAMAAAPDLLTELKTTTFLLTSACLLIEDADARKTALAAVKRAQVVIAKATGGTTA